MPRRTPRTYTARRFEADHREGSNITGSGAGPGVGSAGRRPCGRVRTRSPLSKDRGRRGCVAERRVDRPRKLLARKVSRRPRRPVPSDERVRLITVHLAAGVEIFQKLARFRGGGSPGGPRRGGVDRL